MRKPEKNSLSPSSDAELDRILGTLRAQGKLTPEIEETVRAEKQRADAASTRSRPAEPAGLHAAQTNSPAAAPKAASTPKPASRGLKDRLGSLRDETRGQLENMSLGKKIGLGVGAAVAAALTTPLWAYPLVTLGGTWWLGKKTFVDGGLSRVLRGSKSAAISTGMVTSSVAKKALWGVPLAFIVGSTLIDVDEDRYSLSDAALANTRVAGSKALRLGAEGARFVLPFGESALGAAGDVASSGLAIADGCTSDTEKCQNEVGNAFGAVAGTIGRYTLDAAAGTGKLWWGGYGKVTKGFYSGLYNQTLGRMAQSPGRHAAPADHGGSNSGKGKDLSRREKSSVSALISKSGPQQQQAARESFDLARISGLGRSRYISVCTPLAVDENGKFFPGIDDTVLKAMGAHVEAAARTIDALKKDPASKLSVAVRSDVRNSIEIIVPTLNARSAELEITARAGKYFELPNVVADGKPVPYMCQIGRLDTFLEGDPRDMANALTFNKPCKVLPNNKKFDRNEKPGFDPSKLCF